MAANNITMLEKYGEEKYQALLAYNRKYRAEHKPLFNKSKIKQQQKVKAKCFSLFGGKCQWCGFDDIRALQIDHINGVPKGLRSTKGNPHRGGIKLYRAIINGTYPQSDFQLLCSNCNWIKRYENNETNHKNYQVYKEVSGGC